MNDTKLLESLYRCRTATEFKRLLAGLRNTKTVPIGNIINNRGVIQLSPSPYHALVEGLTNAHDAVVRYWEQQGWLPDYIETYTQAAEYIASKLAEPLVKIYHQNTGRDDHANVTILDPAGGMDELGMKRGPLNILSHGKTNDAKQQGSFGMGSATLLAQSETSVIITREPDSQYYYFAPVFRLADDENVATCYVYLCHADGSLFRADANTLKYQTPHRGDWVDNAAYNVILPEHGTVRRHWGMSVDYWTQKGSSLFSSIPDLLFGMAMPVALVGENDSKQNRRVGRQIQFDRVPVGEKISPKTGTMLLKMQPERNHLFDGRTPIGDALISAWVVAPWLDAKGKSCHCLFTMLDGAASETSAARGIFVTVNSQTHERLASTYVFRHAGLHNSRADTVIQVALDLLSQRTLERIILPSRHGLTEIGKKMITEAVERYLKGHNEFITIDAKLGQHASGTASSSSKTISPLTNDLLGGALAYTVTKQIPGLPGMPGAAMPIDSTITVKRRVSETRLPAKAPPTGRFLVRPCEIETAGFIHIVADGVDDGTEVTLRLVSFLCATDGKAVKIRKGRADVAVHVIGNPALGRRGRIEASMVAPDGTIMQANGGEVVVKVKQKTKATVKSSQPATPMGDETQKLLPSIEMIEVNGSDDPQYGNVFGVYPEQDASYAHALTADKQKLMVYHNSKFAAKQAVEARLASKTDGAVLAAHFNDAYLNKIAINATVAACRPTLIEQETVIHEFATSNAISDCLNLCATYEDPDVRRKVIAAATKG